jgi:hypothetical protein
MHLRRQTGQKKAPVLCGVKVAGQKKGEHDGCHAGLTAKPYHCCVFSKKIDV